MKATIKTLVPKSLKPLASRAYYFPIDTWDRLTGKRDALTPPKRLQYIYIGGGDFKRQGQKFAKFFVELGGLRPDERVLDIGCGVGRMAIPLTRILSEKGRYEGFDVIPEGIAWCDRAITRRLPNFSFRVADLYNPTYNPAGRFRAVEFRFPYSDASFDFAILTSVFTHMQTSEVEHYVAEISRVLAPGGRCFATFYLLNAESRRLIGEGVSARSFSHERPGCRVDNPEVPEDAVAYEEDDVRALFGRRGFHLRGPSYYGKWAGRQQFTSFQDIVIAEKDSAEC